MSENPSVFKESISTFNAHKLTVISCYFYPHIDHSVKTALNVFTGVMCWIFSW